MGTSALPEFDAGLAAPVYLTREIEGIGGEIKARPEDFLVQEIPLYQPCGHGEHIYLYIEKTMLSTLQLRDAIARHFRVRRDAVGHAGLKDKHAITQQVVSVHTPGRTPEDFPSFQHERARVLWVDLHTNKLGRGHLSGNRFSIKVRGVDPTHVMRAQRALTLLSERGCPNRFGPQRFGYLLNNHLVGRALILGDHKLALDLLLSPHEGSPKGQLDSREAYARGDYEGAAARMHKVFKVESRALRALARGASAEEAMRVVDPTAAGFYISSFQSAIFNQVLNQRVIDGTHDSLLEGDIGCLVNGKQTFVVDTHTRDEPGVLERLERHEIGPSGPMWGTSMERAGGEIGEREHQALVMTGLSTKDLESCESRDAFPMIGGSRRPLRIPVISPEVEGGVDEHGAYIRCAFELPKGSFATTVMDEIMKLDPGSPGEASQETSNHE
jgi:tRNA pseudouridine13 synthase